MNRKALSLPILISLVVGNMIGTGIYVLPASLAQYGTLSIAAWIYTALGAMFLALTFANLNKRFPQTGGPYVYCKKAYGRFAGFVVAYTYWLSNLVSIAAIAVSTIGYLGFLTPMLDANTPMYSKGLALGLELGVVWLFTAINLIAIHTAGVVQLFLTVIKVLPLIFVTLFGLGYIHLDNFAHYTAHQSSFSAIGSAAALTFWAFIGLETATIPAENTEGSKEVYTATVFGTLLTCLVYILSTVALMGMISSTELKNSQFPFAEAGTMLFGAHAALLIAICAIVSGLGTLNACVLVQGQIVFAAARDRLFPKRFAKLSATDVPVAGQILSSIVATLFLLMTTRPTLLNQFNYIALLAVLLTLITYLATALSEIKFIMQDKPSAKRIVFSKAFFIAFFAAAYSIWMISNFDLKLLGVGIVLFLAAIPLYFIFIRKEYIGV